MKIDDSNNKLPPVTVPAGKAAKTGQTATLKHAESDKVSLSGTAKAASARDAPIDVAKVERVRDEIARGAFQIDPDRIAGDMIAGARELMAQKR
ncbi:MAG: Anti-sigma-28 factor, FlgM [Pseudomonadota bacterium]